MEQVKVIETFLKAFAETPPKENDLAYLVSRSWVDKALALRSDPKLADGACAEESLGAIDNSDIIQEVIKQSDGQPFTLLMPGTDLHDFELFPEHAWNLVMSWYGLKYGQDPITRIAVNTSTDPMSEPNIIYELHPPVFQVHRLWSKLSPLPIEQQLKAANPPPLVLVRSRKYHMQTFYKELKQLAGIPIDRKFRVFIIQETRVPTDLFQSNSALTTPPDSPGRAEEVTSANDDPWSHLLIDVHTFSATRNDRRLVEAKDQTAKDYYNGKATLQLHELGTDQRLMLDESIGDWWVSTYDGRSKLPSSFGNKSGTTASSRSDSGRSSPVPQGPVTRGRAQRKRGGRSLGAVGLHNLGNTCYMNSALQCVRSVEELTKYFLTNTYVSEINKSNLLGYYGKVAMAYGNLLREIYDEGRGSVSPRDFKTTVGKCRSTFSGFGQQDSQEFLGFLLDGLQEDLSRIKKKPYIEKPDSTDEMINDPEAIREMADKVWDITRKRDDSVIADLFTGMYKSTLHCPECGKISITFDPFNNLTLPIPVEDVVCRTVKFYPLHDTPVKFDVELKKHSAIESLKQFISIRTGVPVNRLMGADEFKGTFFKVYDNNQDASEEIGASDVPAIHELEAVPTNWPGKVEKKYPSMLDVDTPLEAEWDDAKYDRLVVPVFHRRPEHAVRSQDSVPPPHFIVLTREESRDIDLVRRKVLAKVATFTTWHKLTEAKEPESSQTPDTDMVLTNASDGDSSGDSKVVAHSIEGEDDIVDVTMKGAAASPPRNPAQAGILRRFDTRRPALADPEIFLEPELQNLFELSYFANRDDVVPTGWQSFDNMKSLPKLTDRISDVNQEDDDDEDDDGGEDASPESWNSTNSGNEESSNEDISRGSTSQTRMMDESSEEDGSIQSGKVWRAVYLMSKSMSDMTQFASRPGGQRGGHRGGPGGRKKFKGHKTYGKKGNKRRDKQMRDKQQQHRMPAV
jgi:ubiquitin carboxyl-terminal hydrolase 4/11/15